MINISIIIISMITWSLLKGDLGSKTLQLGLCLGLLITLISEALFKHSKLKHRLKHGLLFMIHFTIALVTGTSLIVSNLLKLLSF